MANAPILWMVVPCYNESEVLGETTRRLTEKYNTLTADGKISPESRVAYVDDGSKDDTWQKICAAHEADERFVGIKLSRNRGHQNAVLAGLMTAKQYADCVVSMDADLQDDINAVDGFLEKFAEGCEIVYGVRSSRATDTAFKRLTAEGFYKFMNIMGAEVVYNSADYRLMSRRALDALEQYGERNLFLRGMVTQLGFKTDKVYYERAERFAGESKYPLKKMLSFAWDGITSFSVKPLHLITGTGVALMLAAFIWLIIALCSAGAGHSGEWNAIMIVMIFLAGLQLLAVGVVGEYIGKIYAETKQRPRYIIETILK